MAQAAISAMAAKTTMMLLQKASARSSAATERIARGGVGTVVLIRKRTMHHAETSEASFSRLAAVAVFAP